jgi:hypothetical protein
MFLATNHPDKENPSYGVGGQGTRSNPANLVFSPTSIPYRDNANAFRLSRCGMQSLEIRRLLEGLRVPYTHGMWRRMGVWVVLVMALLLADTSARAEAPRDDEVAATVATLQAANQYPALTRGRVVVVNGQRLVVTQEPVPLATIAQAPPPPPVAVGDPPPSPYQGAIWVAGHWTFDTAGFSWVAGCYVAPRRGYVFVPPRWAFAEEQYFYFNGFYVPYGVFVRSHFNRYYYSGAPATAAQRTHGPYWPVGAPSVVPASSSRATTRDPYWPIGVPR